MKMGDKVVCVNDSHLSLPNRPVRGRVYVIRDVQYCLGERGVYLIGLSNPLHPWWNEEFGFYAWRFRLLDELKAENRERNRRDNSVPRALESANASY